jgi:hypothetical protein
VIGVLDCGASFAPGAQPEPMTATTSNGKSDRSAHLILLLVNEFNYLSSIWLIWFIFIVIPVNNMSVLIKS